MGVKMNLRIITKNRAAELEKGLLKNRFQSRMAAQRPCRQRGSWEIENSNFTNNSIYRIRKMEFE